MLQTSLYQSFTALYFFWALLILLTFAFFSIALMQIGKKYEWVGLLSKLSNWLINILVGIVLYPMASNFGSFWSCHTWSPSHGFIPMKTCHQDLVFPLLSTFSFLYLLVVVYIHSLMTEYIYFDKTTLSVSYSRFETLFSVLTATIIYLMSALSSVFMNVSISSIGLNIASMLSNSLVLYIYIFYYPFYRSSIGRFKIAFVSLLCWFSFSALVMKFFSPSGYEGKTF